MLSMKLRSGECVIRIGTGLGCSARPASTGWTIHIKRGLAGDESPWSDPFAVRTAAFDREDAERAARSGLAEGASARRLEGPTAKFRFGLFRRLDEPCATDPTWAGKSEPERRQGRITGRTTGERHDQGEPRADAQSA